MAKSGDKRVYDIRASSGTGGEERIVAISAECTLLDLHLALLGAFDWRGNYGGQERGAYRIDFATKLYTDGRGSRTSLRRLLRVDDAFVCTALEPQLVLECTVLREYEVRSRRHHPKVLDSGGDEYGTKTATWRAQAAMRREFRDETQDDRRSFEFTYGMLTAIISGPPVMPGQWLGEIIRSPDYAAVDDANRALESIMRLHNDIASALHETPEIFVSQVARMLGADSTLLMDWNRGYVYGMALGGDEWIAAKRDPEMHKLFEPIAAVMEIASSPEKRTWLDDVKLRGDLARAQGMAAVGIAELWRRRLFLSVETVHRRGPKVSPNAPCPCGSGKKYKRCCSPMRVIEGYAADRR